MDLNNVSELIVNTIKSSTIVQENNIPYAHGRLNQNSGEKLPSTYVVYIYGTINGELHADDEETDTGYFVQINIYSDGDFMPLAVELKNAFIANGFLRSDERDLPFDKENKRSNWLQRYQYNVEN